MNRPLLRIALLLTLIISPLLLIAQQTGTVRGFVYEKESGEPMMFATVFLEGTTIGTNSDINGFYNLSNIPAGTYTLTAQAVGFEKATVEVVFAGNELLNRSLYLAEGQLLEEVEISAAKEEARSEVKVSVVKITPKQITKLPSIGGAPDLAQYLQVLPGVIFTGDQGGQLYIRGGSPVQNKVLLDGMTIYNPFHSIGFFSVFETDIIRNADVYTGGYGAEYGGRTSAIIDITTRDGNKKRLAGKVGLTPFLANAILEGPIVPLKKDQGSSLSFMLSAKHSFLDQTSKSIYSYVDSVGLPFSFTDLYGKLSFTAGNGSRLSAFGFSYRDDVIYNQVADIDWNSVGGGIDFLLVPGTSKLLIGGNIAYSNYAAALREADEQPRTSEVGGFSAALNFSSFGESFQLKYGIELIGFRTDFKYFTSQGYFFDQIENSTEFALYGKYRRKLGKLIVDPSLRVHFYASINDVSFEPRLGLKFNATDNLRFKAATGLYAQNFISAVNERDVVNLFVGFLSAPDETIFEPGSTSNPTANKLQTAAHFIGGVEVDASNHLTFNVEPYLKNFNQLININRDKLNVNDPDYVTETGNAYGIDFTATYEKQALYLYLAYSLGYVTRNDGEQVYPPHFDRRHNANVVASYGLGRKNVKGDYPFEVSARWSLGSGFPFTLTQGFFGYLNFDDGISSDYISENPELGIVYSEDRNSGRLPYYHRLDLALRYLHNFGKNLSLEANVGVTNAYNRENIFYFDRIRYERVNQLPILPSAGFNLSF